LIESIDYQAWHRGEQYFDEFLIELICFQQRYRLPFSWAQSQTLNYLCNSYIMKDEQ